VTAGHKGNTWIAPTAAELLLVLLAVGLTAVVKELRQTPAPAVVPVLPRAEPPSPPAVDEPPWPAATPEAAIQVVPQTGEPLSPPPREELLQPAAMLPAIAVLPDSCRITWWRGYVRSQFVAVTGNAADGDRAMIAESPFFSWRSSEPPPESPGAVAAYLELGQTLDGLGWEPDGRGDTWFETRFRRAQDRTTEAVPSQTAPPTSSSQAL
jgi:hypothetical protein